MSSSQCEHYSVDCTWEYRVCVYKNSCVGVSGAVVMFVWKGKYIKWTEHTAAVVSCLTSEGAMASPGKENYRMKSYKNKALNPQEMRRRREEEGIQLRKQKREEQVDHSHHHTPRPIANTTRPITNTAETDIQHHHSLPDTHTASLKQLFMLGYKKYRVLPHSFIMNVVSLFTL